jgi:phage gp46-like protein
MATLILSTRAARRDGAPCKGAPATRSGYWGDSFRADKNAWGSQMFYIDPDLSTTQSVALIQAYAQADLGRLVNAGEAAVVDVRATYAGGGSVSITAGLQINEADADSVKFNASNNSGGWSL